MNPADFIVPALSALVGGVGSYWATHVAMRIELAVLRTRIDGLADSLRGMKSDIDDAHKRLDDHMDRAGA